MSEEPDDGDSDTVDLSGWEDGGDVAFRVVYADGSSDVVTIGLPADG